MKLRLINTTSIIILIKKRYSEPLLFTVTLPISYLLGFIHKMDLLQSSHTLYEYGNPSNFHLP